MQILIFEVQMYSKYLRKTDVVQSEKSSRVSVFIDTRMSEYDVRLNS